MDAAAMRFLPRPAVGLKKRPGDDRQDLDRRPVRHGDARHHAGVGMLLALKGLPLLLALFVA